MASSSKQALSAETFDEYNAKVQAAALKVVKTSVAALPADLGFHRSLHADYGSEVDACAARVLDLANKLIILAGTVDVSGGGKGKAPLKSRDDVVDNFHSLVMDSMDQLLERADISLDEFLGRSKAPAIAINPPSKTTAKPAAAPAGKGRLDPVIQHASHLAKPQTTFKLKPDNFNESPWRSTIKHKYNAQVPLGYIFEEAGSEAEPGALAHPYRYEIQHLQHPSRMFEYGEPVQPKSFEETPFTWVDTADAFSRMLDVLRKATEIAVDLEHHDYRTFSGFVCLMQISTREQDWIVDTLALREELEELNEAFTDPQVVKVFHGAESDIIWLQRDFNLFIINLFDTYHASKLLAFPRHGLANLLEMYCDFTPDKRYQLADWRIRPLPAPMLDYARSDTHYLLYIYDHLRNALLDRGASRSRSASPAADGTRATTPHPHDLIREALARSATTSLRTHEREIYDATRGLGPNGWETMARRWNKMALLPSPHASAAQRVQSSVYRAAHAWRDRVARETDESTRYVLPNHILFQIAERHPADMAALLDIFHSVSPVIRSRARELLDIIKDAVREALGEPTVAPEPEVAVSKPDEPAVSDVLMDGTEVQAPTLSKLWSRGSLAHVARSSLLLEKDPPRPASTFSATTSTLLGNRLIGPVHSVPSDFAQIAARIHSALVVAPTAPRVRPAPSASAEESGPATPAEDEIPNVEGQAEVAFVPAAQRAPREEIVDEALAVVGQRKKRKRVGRSKKDTAVGTAAEASGTSETEPFDYANAPNILDEGYELSRAQELAGSGGLRGKKRKKDKSAAPAVYGDFPMPPRDKREVKGGSKAVTFR